MGNCDMEETPLSEDEKFAYEFFQKSHLIEEARKYNKEKVDAIQLTEDPGFLEFWNQNGQYLTWKLFEEWYPDIGSYNFDHFNKIPKKKQLDLEQKWDKGIDSLIIIVKNAVYFFTKYRIGFSKYARVCSGPAVLQ